MKVLVVTDSLGLPRTKPEVVRYEETWVYQISKQHEVHQLSIGGGEVIDFAEQLIYLKMFEPDVVILQIGIVDCAPRALTKLENKLINKYYITRRLANKLLPRISGFLRRKRGISYTTESSYYHNLMKFKKGFDCKVFAIGILPASDAYEAFLKGIKKKTVAYNAILKKVFLEEYIDSSQIKGEMIMTDNIHLTKKGHRYLYGKLNSIVLASE
jgi:hypothetical protein